MIHNNIKSQNIFFEQWLDAQKNSRAKLSNEQMKVIQYKTTILSKAQNLAAQTREILLVDLDNENYYNQSIDQELFTPQLLAPVSRARELNASGKTVELLGILMMLSAEVNINQLSLKLTNLLASYDSYKKTIDKLDKELENLMDNSDKATKELESAQSLLNELQLKLNSLQDKISQQEKELSAFDKNSSEYHAALTELNKLKEVTITTKQEVANQKVVLSEKSIQAQNALKAASVVFDKQTQFLEQNNKNIHNSHTQKQLTNAARLSELVAFFMQLINKNSETELKSQMSVFESIQKSTQAQMEKKAEEIEEQERKAAELQKTMGCIGKIIGAIVTVVSVVSAAFTGGASLALAGIGIALMATDAILEGTTGQSLTDRIMAPFMEYVFLPLMNVMQNIINVILDYTPLGQLLNLISELTGTDITSIAKTATAALMAIVVIIAVAYVAKTLVKNVAEKLLNSIVGEAIKNMVPKITTQAVKSVSKSLVRSINNVSKKIGLKSQKSRQRALQVDKLMRMLSLGNQGAQVTSSVIVAQFREQAVKALASFKLAQFEMNNIKEILESVIASFERSQVNYRDLAKLVADSLHKEAVTGKQVLNNMRV